jgi:hypothetical protein
MHADILAEGVPQRFAAILRRLDGTGRRGLDIRALDREGRQRPISAYTLSFGG